MRKLFSSPSVHGSAHLGSKHCQPPSGGFSNRNGSLLKEAGNYNKSGHAAVNGRVRERTVEAPMKHRNYLLLIAAAFLVSALATADLTAAQQSPEPLTGN